MIMSRYCIFLLILAITCQGLPDPTSGTVSYGGVEVNRDGLYAFNVVASYSCDTGFTVIGGLTRTCTGDGSSVVGVFDDLAPTCEGDEYDIYC